MTDHDDLEERPVSSDTGLFRSSGPTDAALRTTLAAIQERGAIGTIDLDDAIANADRFVSLLPDRPGRLVDLGSGGGLPGVVIAVRRTDLTVVLVERRLTRADLLRRAVSSLSMVERVTVHGADVRHLAATDAGLFDVATARSFAAPPITAEWAGRLLRPGGLLLVSEPPTDGFVEPNPVRWRPEHLELCGLQDLGAVKGIRRFQRR